MKRIQAAHCFATALAGDDDDLYVRYFWAAHDLPNLLNRSVSDGERISTISEEPAQSNQQVMSTLPQVHESVDILSRFLEYPGFAKGERQRICLAVREHMNIFGGELAQSTYPDCVAICSKGSNGVEFIGSAVVVGERTILTAMHCVTGPNKVSVFTGHDLQDPSSGSLIDPVAIHPLPDADIAVLVLQSAMHVGLCAIAPAGLGVGGQTGIIAGYGPDPSEQTGRAGVRRFGHITVMQVDDHDLIVGPYIGRNEANGPVYVFPGDSGGPLYLADSVRWYVVGVCRGTYGDTAPSIYTRVSPFLDAIKQIPGADIP